ncbi:MAG: amphi-Trp domain-containing protein [Deltaproteobacteria bacterium]|nr:amphi-Trp domain-containing protein [Deltaproteobacteria bacterium]
MSKPKTFEYEKVLPTDDIVAQLEQIVAGIRSGSVSLGEGGVTLAVAPTAKFSIEVKESPKAKSLKLKIKWRNAQNSDTGETTE